MSRIDAPHGLPKIGGSSLVASSRSTTNEPETLAALAAGVGFVLRERPRPESASRDRSKRSGTRPAPMDGPVATYLRCHRLPIAASRQTQRRRSTAFTYETTVSENVPLSAYVGAWGSNVYFGNPIPSPRSTIAGLRLNLEASCRRPGLHPLQLSRRAVGPVLRLQRVRPGPRLRLGVAQIQGAVHGPNFVELRHRLVQVRHGAPTIHLQRDVAFKVARSATYASSASPTTASATTTTGTGRSASPPRSGASISPVAYIDTNLDVPYCGNTMNCDARARITISKTSRQPARIARFS